MTKRCELILEICSSMLCVMCNGMDVAACLYVQPVYTRSSLFMRRTAEIQLCTLASHQIIAHFLELRFLDSNLFILCMREHEYMTTRQQYTWLIAHISRWLPLELKLLPVFSMSVTYRSVLSMLDLPKIVNKAAS
jgi:hypothetical protein